MSDETTPPDRPRAPREDAAAPAWYPHPRRAEALRYWNGVTWVETDATQGWYPDPADRRVLRFWTGRTWGEVLGDDPSVPVHEPTVLPAPAPAPIPAVEPNPRLADRPGTPSTTWVTSVLAVACLVAGTVVGGVAVSTVLGGDDEPGATRTVTASASASGPAPADADDADDEADLVVERVLSSRTLELRGADGKVEVRLLGLGPTPCDTNGPGKDLLKDRVDGQEAVISTLTDPVSGDVGAYVDVDGEDVGELLIRAGLATAAVGHPRAPQYARAQADATAYCPSPGAPTGTPTGTTTP